MRDALRTTKAYRAVTVPRCSSRSLSSSACNVQVPNMSFTRSSRHLTVPRMVCINSPMSVWLAGTFKVKVFISERQIRRTENFMFYFRLLQNLLVSFSLTSASLVFTVSSIELKDVFLQDLRHRNNQEVRLWDLLLFEALSEGRLGNASTGMPCHWLGVVSSLQRTPREVGYCHRGVGRTSRRTA